jgi:hypothetical protein
MAANNAVLATNQISDVSIPDILLKEYGFRPRWLLNDYWHPTWTITDFGSKRHLTISFSAPLPNGKSLDDYPNLYDSIKRIVYGVRTGPLMTIASGTVQLAVANNLITLARWMVSREIFRFEDLTAIDLEDYAELAAFGHKSILNSELAAQRYVEDLYIKAGFSDEDTPEERMNKAKHYVPHRVSGFGYTVLHREVIFRDVGNGYSPPGFTAILDQFEAACGFYQQPATKARMRKAQDAIETEAEPLTVQSVGRYLASFEYLYQHRRYLDDAIQKDLFGFTTASALASKLGKLAGRTQSIPVAQAVPIIERSARWVLDYAPTVLALHAGEHVTQPEAGSLPCAPFPISIIAIYRTSSGDGDEIAQAEALRNGMPLLAAQNNLMTACGVVIAAFTARRAAEIIGLKAGCIQFDATGRAWMRVFIHKTKLSYTSIPVPQIVVKAVRVLEQLSESARELSDSPYLFQYLVKTEKKPRWLNFDGLPTFPIGRQLRQFGFFVDVPASADGTRWAFRPHQFRRLFAIIYIWIYDLPNWGALSQYLRHDDPEMTRRYISDPELGQIIAMANRERTAEILVNAALGKANVSGTQGTRFYEVAKRLHDRLAREVHVVPEQKLAQRMSRLVARSGLLLHAMPWTFCAAEGTSDGTEYKCGKDRGGFANVGGATVSTCKGCEFDFRAPRFLPYLKSSLATNERIAQNTALPIILRNASEVLCGEIKEYIDSVSTKA